MPPASSKSFSLSYARAYSWESKFAPSESADPLRRPTLPRALRGHSTTLLKLPVIYRLPLPSGSISKTPPLGVPVKSDHSSPSQRIRWCTLGVRSEEKTPYHYMVIRIQSQRIRLKHDSMPAPLPSQTSCCHPTWLCYSLDLPSLLKHPANVPSSLAICCHGKHSEVTRKGVTAGAPFSQLVAFQHAMLT